VLEQFLEVGEGPIGYRAARLRMTRAKLRSKAYLRMLPGVYVPSSTELTFAHWVAAWRLKLPDDAILGGFTAAFALGVPWFADSDAVEIIQRVPSRLRPRQGLRVRGDILLPGETEGTAFGLATSGPRTAYDLGRRGGLMQGVAAVDAVLAATGSSVDEVVALAEKYPGARGIRQLRKVLALADPRAESPPESHLRVIFGEAGLPVPVPQFVVYDEFGGFVARLDLAWPELKIGFEYEGRYHRNREQFSRDLRRHNRLRSIGWTIMRIDATQMRTPDAITTAARALLP
jgi:hypothetical protein